MGGEMLAAKADIDALITIALVWNESGELDRMPWATAQALRVTRDSTHALGQDLWIANYDAFFWGGPKEFADQDMVAETDPESVEEVPTYEFELLPGTPTYVHAVAMGSFYWGCTKNESWDSRDDFFRPGTDGPPRAALFSTAMMWWSLKQLGLTASPDMPANPHEPDIFDALDLFRTRHGDLLYWGVEDLGRNVFVG